MDVCGGVGWSGAALNPLITEPRLKVFGLRSDKKLAVCYIK